MRVTHHAGIRRAAGEVFVYKIIYHKITEFFPDVEHEVRKSMLNGGHAGIVETVKVTTTRFLFAAAAGGVVPGFHSNPHHLIALVIKHQGSDRAVDPTTHSYQYFSVATHKKLNCKYRKFKV